MTPEYFSQITDFLIGIITICISVAAMLISFLTYKVAKEALISWKQPKIHDLEIDAKAFSDNILDILQAILIQKFPKNRSEYEKEVCKELYGADVELWKSYNILLCQNELNESFKKDHEIIRKISIKLNNSSNNSELKNLYHSYLLYKILIPAIINNYHQIKINEGIEKYGLKSILKYNISELKMFNFEHLTEKNSEKLYNEFVKNKTETLWYQNFLTAHWKCRNSPKDIQIISNK